MAQQGTRTDRPKVRLRMFRPLRATCLNLNGKWLIGLD